MCIKNVEVTTENLMELIADPDIYVIKEGFFGNGYRMCPIKEANISDILSKNVAIIRVVE